MLVEKDEEKRFEKWFSYPVIHCTAFSTNSLFFNYSSILQKRTQYIYIYIYIYIYLKFLLKIDIIFKINFKKRKLFSVQNLLKVFWKLKNVFLKNKILFLNKSLRHVLIKIILKK